MRLHEASHWQSMETRLVETKFAYLELSLSTAASLETLKVVPWLSL